MPKYILPELSALSNDYLLFPLLYDGKTPLYSHKGIEYPVTVQSINGSPSPLFLGGVVTIQELESITSRIAGFIANKHRSEKLLFIEILEGARWFCNKLLSRLEQEKMSVGIEYKLATVKISSYRVGTQLGSHKVVQPLLYDTGEAVPSLASYDCVIIVDDLVDSGSTFNWLMEHYLPSLEPVAVEAYFMLEKKRQRKSVIDRILQCNILNGRLVPDDWIVGYGPDITLYGTNDLPSLHFCRGELPGGVYAFNSIVAEHLTKEYHHAPSMFRKKWTPYITNY